MKNEFIIFDTEYASFEGFVNLSKEEQKGVEIVQIAAIKVDRKTLKVVEEFNVYIKPIFKPNLTQYFINLTGITDELLDKEGLGFEDAYNQFIAFVDGLDCYSHGWSLAGDVEADGEVVKDNLDMHKITEDKSTVYKNIAPWFKAMYQENNIDIKKQSSGQIAKLLGVDSELKDIGLDEHNAIYDVYSILAGVKYFKAKDLI